jgi:hypothetical protein
MFAARCFVFLLAVACAACGPAREETPPAAKEEPVPDRPSIAETIAAHGERLLAIEGVSAVFEGLTADGLPCIKIGVVRKTPELVQTLPSALEGWPVLVEETGEIKPLPGS